MRLVEIARFASIIEAEIATGALRAQGVQAEMFDRHLSYTDWLIHQAIGGFRVVAPETQAAEARAMLAAVRAQVPPSDFQPSGGTGRTLAAVVLTLFGGAALGMLAVRRRRALPDE